MPLPSNPKDGRVHSFRNGRRSRYNAEKNRWETQHTAKSVAESDIATADHEVPSGLAKGGMAYVTENDKLYFKDNVGFSVISKTRLLQEVTYSTTFKVEGPGRAYSHLSYQGGPTYYDYTVIKEARVMRDQISSGSAPSQLFQNITQHQANGSYISNDPTTTQMISWTVPNQTTYTVYSIQAAGNAGNSQAGGRSGRTMKHGWYVTVPAGGKVYCFGGATAQKYWGPINGTSSNSNQEHNNTSRGHNGGTSQMFIHDPDNPTSGVSMPDGTKAIGILDIVGSRYGAGSFAYPDIPDRDAIATTTGFSLNTTLGAELITQQGTSNQAHIASYGGYPNTSDTENTNYYNPTYVEPYINFPGANSGTNVEPSGGGGLNNGGNRGAFEFTSGTRLE